MIDTLLSGPVLSVLAVVAGGLALVLYKLCSGVKATPVEPFDVKKQRLRYPVQPTLKFFTAEELKAFDGSDPTKPLYVCITGDIFDVSSRRDMYGPGSGYNCFAGKDASRGLALSSLEPKDCNNPDISDLTVSQISTLNQWKNTFEMKYPVVGKLVDEASKQAARETAEAEHKESLGLPDHTAKEIDAAIKSVSANKSLWQNTDASKRAELLQQCIDNFNDHVEEWVRKAAAGHGYDIHDEYQQHLVGEVYMKGPVMGAAFLRGLLTTYESLKAGQMPKMGEVEDRSNGSKSVTVFPLNGIQNILAGGAKAQLIIEDCKQIEQKSPLDKKVKTVGILGAGNFDGPSDILHALFLDNMVVVHKPNPVNYHSSQEIEAILKPLVDFGVLAFVRGGVPAGKQITTHPDIDELLMTGSSRTYNMIVWGSPEPDTTKAPLCKKPFKAELGSVSPYVVVPGEWSDKELRAHAEMLACFKMFNNGHICASPQVILTSKNWPQRQQFLDYVRAALARHPGTVPYYPGCDRSYKQQLESLQTKKGNVVVENQQLFASQLKPVFATDVESREYVTQCEAFCPILSERPVDAKDAGDFLAKATDIINNELWGSLSGSIVIDDKTQEQFRQAFEAFIDSTKLGAIGVNQWGAMVTGFPQLVWGAYPIHTPEDIQSGQGKIGNSLLIDAPTKSVLRYPFMYPSMIKIPKIPEAVRLQGKYYAQLQLNPNYWNLFRLIGCAVRNK